METAIPQASLHATWWSRPSSELRSRARAFGEYPEDLEVDFAQHSRPMLVSAILQHCLAAHDPAAPSDVDVWSWTLGQRTQGLLAVAAASGIAQLEAVHSCDSCGEQLELPLDLASFAREECAATVDGVLDSRQRLSISLPTGRDQQRWLRAGEITDRVMARDLVRQIDGELPADDWSLDDAAIDSIATLLEEHDPMTGLKLQCDCPKCATELSIEFDLEARLLEELRARQWRMLRQIHALASAYHWSEVEIARLPSWRRCHYLAQLGMAGDA